VLGNTRSLSCGRDNRVGEIGRQVYSRKCDNEVFHWNTLGELHGAVTFT
jgi:hypothetical protein